MTTFGSLPEHLTAPVDDGAADHLAGLRVPRVPLPSTQGGTLDIAALATPRAVVYLYPMTGRPDVALPDGWDQIPGARGCTPEACGFRDHHADLARLDTEVVGVSTQDPAYQNEAATRLRLPFPLLSDPDRRLGRELGLPTFRVDGQVLYRRLTLVIVDAVIEHVFHPVFPPDGHAGEVLGWLHAHPL